MVSWTDSIWSAITGLLFTGSIGSSGRQAENERAKEIIIVVARKAIAFLVPIAVIAFMVMDFLGLGLGLDLGLGLFLVLKGQLCLINWIFQAN
ncbi:MAG: hypothetical protein WC467_03550 [Patescibacteria group bacterium]